LCFATKIAWPFGCFAKQQPDFTESKLVTFTLIVYILTFKRHAVKMAILQSEGFCQKAKVF
jgi:hypothetical protein